MNIICRGIEGEIIYLLTMKAFLNIALFWFKLNNKKKSNYDLI